MVERHAPREREAGDAISTAPPRLAPDAHYDVVVVGAGIMGSCAAYHLSKRGKRVLLLEQFELLHRRGSSHGDSRIIRRTYPETFNTEMMSLAYPLWENAQREAGQSVYTKTGGLDWGRKGSKDIESLISACRRHNVDVEVMTSEQANARFPRQLNLPPGFVAVYNEDAGVIHATQAVAMFQRLAMANGAHVVDRTKVIAITPSADRGGGENVRLTTSRGDAICANACVVTCGAWAHKLLAHLGFHTALRPIHTTYAFWRCDSPADFTPPNWPVFIHYDEDPMKTIYSTPCVEYPDLMKVALHTGPDCDPDTRSLVPGYDDCEGYLSPWLSTYLRNVDGSRPAVAEACMYTMTPDHQFILDRLPGSMSNVVIGAGFSGHGFKMGPLIGSIMADLALGETPGVDLAPFSLHRECLRTTRTTPTVTVEGNAAGISKL